MEMLNKIRKYKRKYECKEEANLMACLQSKTTHKTHYVAKAGGVYYVLTHNQIDNRIHSAKGLTFRNCLLVKYTNGIKFSCYEEINGIDY